MFPYSFEYDLEYSSLSGKTRVLVAIGDFIAISDLKFVSFICRKTSRDKIR